MVNYDEFMEIIPAPAEGETRSSFSGTCGARGVTSQSDGVLTDFTVCCIKTASMEVKGHDNSSLKARM